MLDPGGDGRRQVVTPAGPGGDTHVLGADPSRQFVRVAEADHLIVNGVAVRAED